MSQTIFDFNSDKPERATVYPTYQIAAHVSNALNSDDTTLECGWSYTVVEYAGGWAIGVVDEDGIFLGGL
jgi:hypothetical protein